MALDCSDRCILVYITEYRICFFDANRHGMKRLSINQDNVYQLPQNNELVYRIVTCRWSGRSSEKQESLFSIVSI